MKILQKDTQQIEIDEALDTIMSAEEKELYEAFAEEDDVDEEWTDKCVESIDHAALAMVDHKFPMNTCKAIEPIEVFYHWFDTNTFCLNFVAHPSQQLENNKFSFPGGFTSDVAPLVAIFDKMPQICVTSYQGSLEVVGQMHGKEITIWVDAKPIEEYFPENEDC